MSDAWQLYYLSDEIYTMTLTILLLKACVTNTQALSSINQYFPAILEPVFSQGVRFLSGKQDREECRDVIDGW